MASTHVKHVQRKLAELDLQLAEINAKRSILLEMLEEENPTPKKIRSRRGNAKEHVIDYLTKVEASGLNATIVVEMAEKDGISLERSSVSSLLSRLKHDGTVTYDEDGKYRLTNFPRVTKPTLPGSVTPLRTSGVTS